MKILPSLLLFTASLALSACSTPTNTVERANPEATPTVVDSRVTIFDSGLARRLDLVEVNEAQAGDLLQVQATFRNKQVKPRAFSYQFQWIQQNGMVVQSPTPVWRRGFIEGGQTISVAGTAPKPGVVDFRLSLREID